MRDEPKSELARYAFGFSDKKPGWLFWAIQAVMLAFVLWSIFSAPPANAACHKFSVWKYPWPQRCKVTALAPPTIRSRARIAVVLPAPREIPLPSLIDIEWGHAPDDELRGRLLLRIILQAKEDR